MASPASTRLCDLCTSFVAALSKALAQPDQDWSKFKCEHYRTIEDLRLSSENACRLCVALLKILTKEALVMFELTDRDVTFEQILSGTAPYVIGVETVNLDVPYAPMKAGIDRLIYYSNHGKDFSLSSTLEIRQGTGDVPLMVRRQLGQHLDVELCKTWLGTCQQSHQRCAASKDELFPTRILDVSGLAREPPTFNLVESKGRRGKYLALSYCWGRGRQLTTTTESYAAHLQRIELCNAPKTIRDAIWLTHRIGFRYVWIDCLCIVQDDFHDWQHEASRMATVYQNAVLTLAIADAAESREGFLHPRAMSDVEPVELFLSNGSNDISGSILICDREDKQDRYSFGSSPKLDTRAWTLQEKVFSPRKLYCRTDTIEWVCSSTVYEGTCRYPLQNRDLRPDYDYLRVPNVGASPQTVFKQWRHLVEHYSSREISHETDRLPAIAALASQFGEALVTSSYLAGLWSGDLLCGLLWRRNSIVPRFTSKEVDDFAASPSAPSWSWVSSGGRAISYSLSENYEFESHARWEVEVLQEKVRPLSKEAPYGHLAPNPMLKVRGRTASAIATAKNLKQTYLQCQSRHGSAGSYGEAIFFPDRPWDDLMGGSGLELCCLLMTHFHDGQKSGWIGLVLQAVDAHKSTYRRVGLARWSIRWVDEEPNTPLSGRLRRTPQALSRRHARIAKNTWSDEGVIQEIYLI